MDIAGRAGLFLAGKVSPELQGVEISITERGTASPLITVATDENGAYRCESPAIQKTDFKQEEKMENVGAVTHRRQSQELDKSFYAMGLVLRYI